MKKLSYQTTRKIEGTLLRATLLVGIGVLAGALLGNMAAGKRLASPAESSASFTALSANPDAAAAPTTDDEPCHGCPDSYGVAARLRAERERRADEAFRAPDAMEPDVDAPDAEGDYRYGGGFPDLPSRASALAAEGADATERAAAERDEERTNPVDAPGLIAEDP